MTRMEQSNSVQSVVNKGVALRTETDGRDPYCLPYLATSHCMLANSPNTFRRSK